MNQKLIKKNLIIEKIKKFMYLRQVNEMLIKISD